MSSEFTNLGDINKIINNSSSINFRDNNNRKEYKNVNVMPINNNQNISLSINQVSLNSIEEKKFFKKLRRNSANFSNAKKIKEILNNKDDYKKNWVESTKEAVEIDPTLKDLQWKLGINLNNKILELKNELNNILDLINQQEIKNFNESKIFEKRKKQIQEQIQKEEKENIEHQKQLNSILNIKKMNILNEINNIEEKKKNLKNILNNKFKEMMNLKTILKKHIDDLDNIKKEILSRKFVINNKTNNNDSDTDDFKLDSLDADIPHGLNENNLSEELTKSNYLIRTNDESFKNKINSNSYFSNNIKKNNNL